MYELLSSVQQRKCWRLLVTKLNWPPVLGEITLWVVFLQIHAVIMLMVRPLVRWGKSVFYSLTYKIIKTHFSFKYKSKTTKNCSLGIYSKWFVINTDFVQHHKNDCHDDESKDYRQRSDEDCESLRWDLQHCYNLKNSKSERKSENTATKLPLIDYTSKTKIIFQDFEAVNLKCFFFFKKALNVLDQHSKCIYDWHPFWPISI